VKKIVFLGKKTRLYKKLFATGRSTAAVPRALRAVTAQRAVPATDIIENSVRMRHKIVAGSKLHGQIEK
jgi:hypothetical protein